MKWLKYTLLFLLTGIVTFITAKSDNDDSLKAYATIARKPIEISDTSELLASHETTAIFDGVINKGCRFLTAQCPDSCNHTKTWAEFTIIGYTDFHSYSQYGKKQSHYAIALDGAKGTKNKKVLRTLKRLEVGDTVTLNWNHLYITSNGASYPTRPIQQLSKK